LYKTKKKHKKAITRTKTKAKIKAKTKAMSRKDFLVQLLLQKKVRSWVQIPPPALEIKPCKSVF